MNESFYIENGLELMSDEFSNNIHFLPNSIDINEESFDSDMNQQNNSFHYNLINSDNKEINLEEKALNANNDYGQNLSINSGFHSTASTSTLPKHYKFENIENEIVQKFNLDEKTKKAFKNDERVKSIEEEASDENFAVEKRRRAKKGTIVEEEEKENEKKKKREKTKNSRRRT